MEDSVQELLGGCTGRPRPPVVFETLLFSFVLVLSFAELFTCSVAFYLSLSVFFGGGAIF